MEEEERDGEWRGVRMGVRIIDKREVKESN